MKQHEWNNLKPGDVVSVNIYPPAPAVVKAKSDTWLIIQHKHAWTERPIKKRVARSRKMFVLDANEEFQIKDARDIINYPMGELSNTNLAISRRQKRRRDRVGTK